VEAFVVSLGPSLRERKVTPCRFRYGKDMAMLREQSISSQTTVASALAYHPGAPAVFKQLGMATCVGCVMAPFETLAEAADEFGVDLKELLTALQDLKERERA
jgi:hybrid cluster-associated redox disulfide protein